MLARKPARLLVLALIVALGGALRFYGLGIQPFWNDEFNTWGVASQESLREVMYRTSDVHPWGYFLVVHAFRSVLGDAEWAIRLPSAIAGFLAVPALYALGSRLYSYKEGLAAALILAVSHEPIYRSQEARMYSVLVLLVIICAYLWVPIVKALRDGRRPPLWTSVGYVLAAAACAYTHNFGLLFVFLQGCYALLCTRNLRSMGWLFATYGLVVLLYLPAIPRLTRRAALGQANLDFTERPGPADLAQFAGFLFSIPVTRVLPIFLLGLALIFASLFALTIYRAARDGNPSLMEPSILLWTWLFVPLAVAVFISWSWQPVWTDRYLIIVLPAAYLLLARALVELPALVTGNHAASFACTLALCGVLTLSLFYPKSYYSLSQKDTRGAIQYMAEQEDGDLLYYCMGALPRYASYYLRESGRAFEGRLCSVEDARRVEESLRSSGARSFYFADLSNEARTRAALRYLEANYELVEQKSFYGQVDVYRFSTSPPSA